MCFATLLMMQYIPSQAAVSTKHDISFTDNM